MRYRNGARFGLIIAGLQGAVLPAQGVYGLIAEQSRTAFTIQGAGARAIGTGGAFIAVADDATAVSFNPAGLAQLLTPEISFTGQTYSRSLQLDGYATKSLSGNPTTQDNSNIKDHHTSPSFASFTVPWKRGGLNTAFQVSYQRILDFDLAEDTSYTVRPTGAAAQHVQQNLNQSGGVDLYSVALGAELSPRILVGASINVWQGSWMFSSVSDQMVGGVSDFASNLSQSNNFRGLNANLGVIWRSEYLNLGAVWRTPFTATYTFENYLTQPDPATNLITTTHGVRTAYQVKWPETIGWGLGVHPIPTLLLTADWSYTPWSNANFVPQGTAYDNRNFFDLVVNSRTPNVTTFHSGTEWVAYVGDSVVVPLRAGWFKEPQPIMGAKPTDQQRVDYGWTAGFGLKLNRFTVDVAFKDSRSLRYASRFNADAAVGGVETYAYGYERLEEKRYFLSLIWQMDTEATHRAFRWLFLGS
jgi:long-chain fatty acid transport protein